MKFHLALCSPLLGGLLAAQTTTAPALTGKQFLPDGYRMVMHADLATMRTSGVWDEVEASAMKLVMRNMEREAGFPLAALDRVTLAVADVPVDDAARGHFPEHSVLVHEGNAPLAFGDRVARNWEAAKVGGFDVFRRGDTIAVAARPELQVQGHASLVEPVLAGKARGGMPCPDILSLLSARERRLAYAAFDLTHASLPPNPLRDAFPDANWPEGQQPTFLLLCLRTVGDADDPHLGIDAVLRHATEGDGLAVSEQAMKATLERLQAMPQMRAVAPVLKKAVIRRDRTDVVASLDAGRVRDAIGHAAMLAGLLFVAGEQVEVRAAAPVPVPVPPPATEPKK
jgi:hypothetical protein